MIFIKGYILFTEYIDLLRADDINIHRATAKKHALRYIVKKFGHTLYIREDVVDDYIEFYLKHHRLDYKLLNTLPPSKAEIVLSEHINLKEVSEIVNYHPYTIRYQFLNNNGHISKLGGKIYLKKDEIKKFYGVELN